jgi:hypothetical protein
VSPQPGSRSSASSRASAQGRHPVPKADVLRRFKRGWRNFDTVYRPLADAWAVDANFEVKPKLLEQGP